MSWSVEFLEEARRDMRRLDHSAQIQVLKGIQKVAGNPVSIHEGGYGKPPGNHNDSSLSGLFKIKFRDLGLRVVYKTEMVDSIMKIIVVSARSDDQVYREAARRRTKYDL
ncbi:MAG: type II toxin-antitoxin system RelE/ParE family toxin [Clostridia bacterium]|nr:type II toxin-antitoxin system RelE/ParE family toxin [Clostridia bacterium]